MTPDSPNFQLDSRLMGQPSGSSAVGARIKKRRLEVGLTQAQLGEPKLTSAYISIIEAGRRRPSPKALGFIADRLGITVEELLSGRPAGLEVELELAIHAARRDADEGALTEAERALAGVVKQAKKHGLKRAHARALEARAALTDKSGDPEAALALYQEAEELWRDEPSHLRFEAVAGAAWCTQQLGDARMAAFMLDSYRRELEASGKADPVALMRTHSALIDPYFASGLPEKAAESAREAIRLETRVDNPEQIACMHLSVARSLLYEGHHEDALQSLRKAEDIYLAAGWRNRAAKAQINEAIVLAKKENFEGARDKLLLALETLETSPNPLDEALACNELAYVMRHLGDIHGALTHLERAKELLEEGDAIERAFNERELGLCLAESDPDIAERHLKRAIDLYRSVGAATELATTFKALGELYSDQGKTDLAIEALRDGLAAVEERSA